MKPILIALAVLLTAACWAAPATAGELPVAGAGETGLNAGGTAQLDAYLQGLIDSDSAAGIVAALVHKGKIVYFESFGKADRAADKAMPKDAIFRIYSMSKPITTTAAMQLYEQGRFDLDDPVSKYLPELTGLKAGIENESGGLDLVDAAREITIRDLMRHTSGFTYGFYGTSKVDQAYLKSGILRTDKTLADTVDKLAKLPLKHQPGTQWEYGVSTDVLARLVEVVSGESFDTYLKKHIFDPLNMEDSFFNIPESKHGRLPKVYTLSPDRKIAESRGAGQRNFLEPTTYFSGGGGLVSTAMDYMLFCQTILNQGELNGVRILKADTVALMTQDQLGDIPVGAAGERLAMTGGGFGLGFRVLLDPAASPIKAAKGTYSWGGAASTIFWIDPVNELIGVYMTQIMPADFIDGVGFQNLVYGKVIPQ